MDLSANSLTGEIPKEIGSLVGLLSLNFSGNLLIGNIPESIGNMELMESLDLSMNRLNGKIPPSFSNLNFLNHFNVSYNNLTGQIPTSTQLQSFENLSYMGNHLCGPPLTKNCTAKGIPTDIANNGSSSEGRKVNSPYVSLALGFVMGFWGVVAPLFFIRSWRIAYYRKLDHIYGKLYVFWATMVYCFSHNVSSSSLDVGVVPYGGSDIEVEVGADYGTKDYPGHLQRGIDGDSQISWGRCEWIGVVCHNSTGHVNQLHLAPLSEPDDFAPYADHEWEAYYNSLLVGKINPSLLELKHLSSLDLSNNNFSSIQIPKFFGLLESLTYLNLSRARFQGEIPHNLGNLSKLQFLDLGGNDLKSESLQWVSGLSSLQYLDLSSTNLSKANDWPVQVTFILPSLLELHLKSCGLEDDPTSISVNSSKSLLALDLFWNRLTSVPKSIFCLHGLVSIDLSGNSL
ncbi:receptor-like protein EIX2 [Gossypium hirsutum]|uniref:Receptor-like protein EIX2 n=1 Tax=Gossypium hirsutum TaxID=3635 RepID=A0ABM2Z5Y5_GOSHI|nr:receptor-like protein EIX2 [Gossypium hirsutum]